MEDEARVSEARFVGYVESLAEVLGYVDRAGPLKDYCTGLLMPGERKSVEPIASVVAPSRVSAEHQSLLHFVGQSAWSDESVLAKVRELVVPAMETQGRIEAWIVDDTGFVKKGVHRRWLPSGASRRASCPPHRDDLSRSDRGFIKTVSTRNGPTRRSSCATTTWSIAEPKQRCEDLLDRLRS